MFLVLFFFCTAKTALAQLQIVPQTNALALAQQLVGEGITISNVTISGSSFSTGFFYNQGGTGIGLDSGIVLSSGKVKTSAFDYGFDGGSGLQASYTANTPGDAQLTALINNQATFDAAILEFDFIPLGDTVTFRYVFSSEEYPQYTCSNWNDVFAFFISGPGITGSKNIALVPGTNIPVAINSINSGIPGTSGSIGTCTAMGPGSPFTQFYVDNIGNQYFTHNGHTTILTAKSVVQPCQVYHLKIAIADVLDHILDSGVFLEAKSLKSDPIHIVPSTPMVNGFPYLVEGCQTGGVKVLRSRKSPIPQTVTLTVAGTAQNSIDVQTIPATVIIPANDSVGFVALTPVVDNIAEGIEILKIYISNGCSSSQNFYLDSVEIQIRDFDTLGLNPRDTVRLCRTTNLQLTASGNFSTFQWTPGTGLSSTTISNPVLTGVPGMTTYTVTATQGTCNARDSVKVKLKEMQLVSKKDINCKNGTTGEIRVSGGWAWKAPVQFSVDGGAYGTDSSFLNLPVGTHIVRIKDATGCVDSIPVTLVQAFPDLLVADSITSASCMGTNGKLQLTGSGGLSPYLYALDNGAYGNITTFTLNSGNHTISIKDSNGCITTRPVVVATDSLINFSISPNADACNGSPTAVLTINPTGGSGTYQYSTDGITFQNGNALTINTTTVTVTVQDNKGCTATQTINIPLNQNIFVFAGNDTTICEGDQVHFLTQSNAATFSWAAHPTLSSLNIADPVATPVQTTTYYLTAVKDVCTVRDTIKISVWPAPVPNAGPDSTICFGRTINLQGSGGVTYNWLPVSGVSNATVSSPVIRPTQPVNMYFLSVKDINGCSSLFFDTVRVHVTPAVQVFAGRDTILAINEPLQLNGVDLGNSGVTQYSWTPVTGLSNPLIPNPVVITDHDVTYTLTMTTPEGCMGTDQIVIRAYEGPELYVPSGFTPNGDGRNDVLRPIVIGMKEFHYFRIYNRWGQLVFASSSEKTGWDGTINGRKQNTATFIWMAEMLDFKGRVVYRQGATTLIR